MFGVRFEAEIREQPDVWRRIAESRLAESLVVHLRGTAVLFIGSGSSLFAAQLAALAFRRRGLHAAALAATEARFDAAAYRHATVVALSQSGKSADLIAALELVEPALLVALTNDPASPLAAMADVVVDVMAGPEVAVPASKSVTSLIAILLWAASILGGGGKRTASSLHETADDVGTWLAGPDVALVNSAASALAHDRGVIVVGAGYGGPVANEIALKIKEASYVHAEGFPAGEFRHGSSAMLDASTAIVGIVDEASRDIVVRPLDEAARTGAERFVIGASVGDVPRLGPITGESFNTLGWLVTGQLLALALGRARGVESDAPRGLSKAIV